MRDLTTLLDSPDNHSCSTDSPTTKPRKQQPISKRQTRQHPNNAKQKRRKRTQPSNNQPNPPILAKNQPTTSQPKPPASNTKGQPPMDTGTADQLLDTWAARLSPARTPWAFDTKAKTEWRKRLTDYPAPIARDTWDQWRRHNTEWPSLYTFDDMLKARTRAGRHTDDCHECDNTGWIEAPDFIGHNGHTYTASQPCECKHGQERRSSKIWMERNG